MHFFFLAAGLLALAAAVLWCSQAFGRGGGRPEEAGEAEPRPPELPREGLEALGAAAEALAELLEHPELGGPGFITVRFPPLLAADGRLEAAALYPNIREALYRRILRRELSPEALRAAGMPEALLALSPELETESGGMVRVTVLAAGLDPALAEHMACRRGRQEVLDALAEDLGRRCPGLSVRRVGSELLLAPVLEREEA